MFLSWGRGLRLGRQVFGDRVSRSSVGNKQNSGWNGGSVRVSATLIWTLQQGTPGRGVSFNARRCQIQAPLGWFILFSTLFRY